MRPFGKKLLCSFVLRKKAKLYIEYLYSNKITDKIFILESNKKDVLLFMYNILLDKKLSNLKEYGNLSTIVVQRNKDTNTIYSIDSLNILIENIKMITEQEPKDIKIDWSEYSNSLLLTSDGKLNKIDTKLLKILTLDNRFDINKVNI
jgi:hypothetical protein